MSNADDSSTAEQLATAGPSPQSPKQQKRSLLAMVGVGDNAVLVPVMGSVQFSQPAQQSTQQPVQIQPDGSQRPPASGTPADPAGSQGPVTAAEAAGMEACGAATAAVSGTQLPAASQPGPSAAADPHCCGQQNPGAPAAVIASPHVPAPAAGATQLPSASSDLKQQLQVPSEPGPSQQAAPATTADKAAAAQPGKVPKLLKQLPPAHAARQRQLQLCGLKRKFADLTAQVEGAICEAKALVQWRAACPRPLKVVALEPHERHLLDLQHQRRLAEVCSRQGLSVIKAVMAHKFAWPFNSPVDLTQFKDYLEFVTTPMDLGTMKTKAENAEYKDPSQLQEDFRLVFSNAKTYNPAGSDVYYMATVLQEHQMERWSKVMGPKLAEDLKTKAAEEADLVRKKAAHLQKTEELAMQDCAVRVVSLFDELHELLASVRADTALALAPMDADSRQGLADALSELPSNQLESALLLLVMRLAPHLANAMPESKHDLEVDLSRCNALELRQLQHLVAACKGAAGTSQQQGSAAAAATVVAAGDAGAGTQQQQAPAATLNGPVVTRVLTGFPAGTHRGETLSKHAGVQWPGNLVGAGFKSHTRTAQVVTSLEEAALPGTARSAGAARYGGWQRAAALKRRSSDTGAARPPLPPGALKMSRLGPGGAVTPFAGPAATLVAAGSDGAMMTAAVAVAGSGSLAVAGSSTLAGWPSGAAAAEQRGGVGGAAGSSGRAGGAVGQPHILGQAGGGGPGSGLPSHTGGTDAAAAGAAAAGKAGALCQGQVAGAAAAGSQQRAAGGTAATGDSGGGAGAGEEAGPARSQATDCSNSSSRQQQQQQQSKRDSSAGGVCARAAAGDECEDGDKRHDGDMASSSGSSDVEDERGVDGGAQTDGMEED